MQMYTFFNRLCKSKPAKKGGISVIYADICNMCDDALNDMHACLTTLDIVDACKLRRIVSSQKDDIEKSLSRIDNEKFIYDCNIITYTLSRLSEVLCEYVQLQQNSQNCHRPLLNAVNILQELLQAGDHNTDKDTDAIKDVYKCCYFDLLVASDDMPAVNTSCLELLNLMITLSKTLAHIREISLRNN